MSSISEPNIYALENIGKNVKSTIDRNAGDYLKPEAKVSSMTSKAQDQPLGYIHITTGDKDIKARLTTENVKQLEGIENLTLKEKQQHGKFINSTGKFKRNTSEFCYMNSTAKPLSEFGDGSGADDFKLVLVLSGSSQSGKSDRKNRRTAKKTSRVLRNKSLLQDRSLRGNIRNCSKSNFNNNNKSSNILVSERSKPNISIQRLSIGNCKRRANNQSKHIYSQKERSRETNFSNENTDSFNYRMESQSIIKEDLRNQQQVPRVCPSFDTMNEKGVLISKPHVYAASMNREDNDNVSDHYSYVSNNEASKYPSKISQFSTYSDIHRYPTLKVPEEQLWGRFEKMFKNSASTNRHSGEVISRRLSTEWMKNVGIVDDFLTEKEAAKAFQREAGAKITLNVKEYKDFLIMLSLKMKLPYYEIYRRMCGY